MPTVRDYRNTPHWIKILFKSGKVGKFYFNSLRTKQRWYRNISDTLGTGTVWEFRTTRGVVTLHTLDIDIVGAS